MKEIRYYERFTDDFVESPQQALRLPEDYVYVRTGWLSRLWAAVVYGLALFFSFFYCRIGLRLRILCFPGASIRWSALQTTGCR